MLLKPIEDNVVDGPIRAQWDEGGAVIGSHFNHIPIPIHFPNTSSSSSSSSYEFILKFSKITYNKHSIK